MFEYRDLDENLVSEILKKLCEAAPKSAIALHLEGRETTSLYDDSQEKYQRNVIFEIIKNSQSNNTALEEINFDVPIQPCCLEILESLKVSDSVDICYGTAVNRKAWIEERKLRITGSRIYDLFTYAKNPKANWQHKSIKFFWPQAVLNKYVKHGIFF